MKPHVFRFLQALHDAIAEQGALLTGADVSHRHRLPPQAIVRAALAHRLMGPLLEFEDLIASAEDPEKFPAALTAMQHRIAMLERGGTLVFRGGWHDKSEYASEGYIGAVICVLERSLHDPNSYALVVCNSGSGWGTLTAEGTKNEAPYESGLEYHEASSEAYPTPRVRTAMRIKNVQRHRLLDEGFLGMLLGQLAMLRDHNSCFSFYDVLLPHLAGSTLDVHMRDEGQGPFEEVQQTHTRTSFAVAHTASCLSNALAQVFEGTKAHYLPLVTCLNYLLARPERSAQGMTSGLSGPQRSQVAFAKAASMESPCSDALRYFAACVRAAMHPLELAPFAGTLGNAARSAAHLELRTHSRAPARRASVWQARGGRAPAGLRSTPDA